MINFRKNVYNNIECLAAMLGFAIFANVIYEQLIVRSLSGEIFTNFILPFLFAVPSIVIGVLLIKYKASKSYDTKGFAYIYLLLMFIPAFMSIVNAIVVTSVYQHTNFFGFVQTEVILISLYAGVVLGFTLKKDIVKDVIVNAKNKFDIYFLLYIAFISAMYLLYILSSMYEYLGFNIESLEYIFPQVPNILLILSIGLLVFNLVYKRNVIKINAIAFFVIAIIIMLDSNYLINKYSSFYYYDSNLQRFLLLTNNYTFSIVVILVSVGILKLIYINSLKSNKGDTT